RGKIGSFREAFHWDCSEEPRHAAPGAFLLAVFRPRATQLEIPRIGTGGLRDGKSPAAVRHLCRRGLLVPWTGHPQVPTLLVAPAIECDGHHEIVDFRFRNKVPRE